jgi:hypothetical protein
VSFWVRLYLSESVCFCLSLSISVCVYLCMTESVRQAKTGKLRGVLTTNFDIFIERALRQENVPFKLVVTSEEFQEYFNSGCKEFAVLKIHGTVERPETIVAVANHYKSGKGESWFSFSCVRILVP